ncbi:MAG: sugar ABC transporter permease [Spirochaetales bacterium]|uniref:Sugar ABC transporter permease n=1 Tax=Candidatus Thalassospirochaeta sargassi TaxID=3119039 RepID=A0AAJ1IB74_9SPIO|nr:sugar ABC transporter permease [Spirochaetales bacterium]
MKRSVLAAHLMPLLIPFSLFFVYGMVLTLAQSTGWGAVDDYRGGFFSAYEKILKDPLFLQSTIYSLWIALASSVGALFFGSLLALAIWQLPRRFKLLAGIYRLPIILPHITIAFIVLFLFSNRGMVPALFYHWSSGETLGPFSNLLYSRGGGAIILAYIYKEAPFVVLMELAVLQNIPEERIITARQLGAGGFRIYLRVILPQLRAVINTLFVILFLYSLGAFDIPFILGISEPSMLSIQIYNLYFKSDLVNRPLVMARLSLMFLFSLGFILIYLKAAKNLDERVRKI